MVSAAGRAFYLPLASNITAEGKARNRRVEIILAPQLENPADDRFGEVDSRKRYSRSLTMIDLPPGRSCQLGKPGWWIASSLALRQIAGMDTMRASICAASFLIGVLHRHQAGWVVQRAYHFILSDRAEDGRAACRSFPFLRRMKL